MYARNGQSVELNDDPAASVDFSRSTHNDIDCAKGHDMHTTCIFESDSITSENHDVSTERTVIRDSADMSPKILNGIKLEASESSNDTNDVIVNIKSKKDREKLKGCHAEYTRLNYSPQRNGKSPLTKKRKGGTWYSVLSSTYKSRSVEFKRFFKDIPDSEKLIVDYSCALQKDILVHGRLYVSQSYLCFYANIFRWATVLQIPLKDVTKLTKERTAKVIPNAIQVVTRDDKFFFTSISARDRLFVVLDRVWKACFSNQALENRELWQWIHYSYGEELGLTSGDDDDYCQISTDERLRFQLQLPQRIKANQSFSGSTVAKEPGDDFLLLNSGSPSSLLSVPVESSPPVIQSLPPSDDQPSPPTDEKVSAFEGVTSESPKFLQTKNLKELMPSRHDASSDVNSDEEGVDLCCDHDHFSIQVIDEVFDIPIDSVFAHCFTDSALFRDFVAAKKTFDVVLSPWPEESDANGTKVRNIAYTLSLNYSIGPKVSPSTERQIMHPESKPGHFYLIDTECVNGGIPYGENFYVVNRYCISRLSNTRCRFRITSQIKYRKSVWGLVKSFIEKNASAGIKESFGVLADLLRQESNRQLSQLPNVRPCNLARKKVLRRKRTSPRAAAKGAAADTQGPGSAKLDVPVGRTISHAILNRIKDEWHIRLTYSSLVRIIAGVLLILVVFNAILFYKLWTLEASTSTLLHSRLYDSSTINEPPKSSQEWLRLLDHQHMLHEAEVNQWKGILSASIELLDQMTHALSELRSSLDDRSVYRRKREENSEVPLQ